MNLEQVLPTFTAESRELLEDMESALLEIEHQEDRAETINRIFRTAHTIKGSAGLFGLNHIVAFTHVLESVLDRVRDGKIEISKELIVLMLECCDHIGVRIGRVEARQLDADEAIEQQGAPLIARLQVYLSTDEVSATLSAKTDLLPAQGGDKGFGVDAEHWHISLRFGPDVLKNGMDPLSFIRYLGTLGSIHRIVTLTDQVPALDQIDPENCYLGFEISFASDADKAAIENVFEFVRDDCAIQIIPPHGQIEHYLRLIHESPGGGARLGEILVECGSLTANELADALAGQQTSGMPQPLGELLVEQGKVSKPVVEAALAKQRDTKSQESKSVRVDADKLDTLINLVGELIISAASANLIARGAAVPGLSEATSKLAELVEEVRDSALQLRMVKIGATFNRFQRVVHDVSREIGKDIGLVVKGEETELDKTVVEKLGDPLTHLVRNAIDHGIEPSDIREARGKPVKGMVTLNAYHDSGSIVIQVIDDGGGLKRDRILAKAIERGLIEPGRNLSDTEIYGLVFEPGFSTADAITNLSGRGVGMDVVKRNIVALRGTVEINSAEGIGTTVTVRLPLTLAIIDGFMVGLDKSVFVIPLDMIEECVEFSAERGHDYTNLRGEVLPFIRLRELFEIDGEKPRRESIVVIKHAGHKAGLVVDSLLGEFQTVIKPLGQVFSQVRCISGSTILGSGEVALILDVPALVQQAGDGAARKQEVSVAISAE